MSSTVNISVHDYDNVTHVAHVAHVAHVTSAIPDASDTHDTPTPMPMHMSRLLEVLSIIPNEDLHRTWEADITIILILIMTSKKVNELVKKLRLPAVISLKRLTSCRFSENLLILVVTIILKYSKFSFLE